MDEKKLISAMDDLKSSNYALYSIVEKLIKSVDSLTAIQNEVFKNDSIDMMRELNGSLHELTTELENNRLVKH